MMRHRIVPVLLGISLAGQVAQPVMAAAGQGDVNFKIYKPAGQSGQGTPETPVLDSQADAAGTGQQGSAADASAPDTSSQASTPESTASAAATSADSPAGEGQKIASKVLQGYIRVVPSGTKIPIIMDTAVDSDTSQEGDEFSARTAEDLTIDGGVVVPAGSVIKGRIAQLNAPRRFDRSGSVALKFDTVTTPDNRQIPLVANIVARGGVVHARRGMKDIAIETGMVTLPVVAGLGIGLLAGNASKSSSLKGASGAVIGATIGLAVGAVILMAKKGKRVDVRPGDELKIELAEDLRMPM